MVDWDKASWYIIYGVIAFFIVMMVLGVSGIFETEIPSLGEECDLPDAVCSFGTLVGFPKGWLNTKTFLWYSLIPILGIWLIIFGFLDRIRIFRKGINSVLSFLIAFSTVPLGFFVILVSTIFAIMGVYSVILFFILFIIGTGFFVRAMWRGWSGGMIEQQMGIERLYIRQKEKEFKEKEKTIKDLINKNKEIERAVKKGKMGWQQAQNATRQNIELAKELEKELKGIRKDIKIKKEIGKRTRRLEKATK